MKTGVCDYKVITRCDLAFEVNRVAMHTRVRRHMLRSTENISKSRIGDLHCSSVQMSSQGVGIPFSQQGYVFHPLESIIEGTTCQLLTVKNLPPLFLVTVE